MGRIEITAEVIEALLRAARDRGKVIFSWDTEVHGFGARASPQGALSWVFQHWIGGRGGRAVRITFGKGLPLGEARKEAQNLRADVNKGVDLVSRKEQERKAKLERLQATKLCKAVQDYLRLKSKPGSYWAEVRRQFEKEIVPKLGKDRPVAELTKAELRALWEAKQTAGNYGAARYRFAVLRSFLRWCAERDIIIRSPIADLSPPSPVV